MNSRDIKPGQVWQRRSSGVLSTVVSHTEPDLINPIVGIKAKRYSEIRASGLRERYRLVRDICEGCSHGPACVVLPCRDCGKSWHLLGQISNPFVCPSCEDEESAS